MAYPNIGELWNRTKQLELWAQLKHEYAAPGVRAALDQAAAALDLAIQSVLALEDDAALKAAEPDDLAAIRKLRTAGPRRMLGALDAAQYREKLAGAFLARTAGCTLGAIVEGRPVEWMENWAAAIGDPFPPTDYWTKAFDPAAMRYIKSACRDYTRGVMNAVPVDDDVAYTLLGLLIAEQYGVDFTTADVAKAWLQYLPMAYTAEAVTLENLKKGIAWDKAGEIDNPYCQWIGADIRSDPWAYIAPGLPEKAAEFAYRDAYLSHRRNGIYGEMYFSAAQAAAFAAKDAAEALEIGLSEIPAGCTLYKDVVWALENANKAVDYKSARSLVDERFQGMSSVHTNNNACLTIFGLLIGGDDVTRVLAETVAMGLDNDCTAATAGSIVGALVGKSGIPAHWIEPFNGRVLSYLNGEPEFSVDDLVDRFAAVAGRVFDTL